MDYEPTIRPPTILGKRSRSVSFSINAPSMAYKRRKTVSRSRRSVRRMPYSRFGRGARLPSSRRRYSSGSRSAPVGFYTAGRGLTRQVPLYTGGKGSKGVETHAVDTILSNVNPSPILGSISLVNSIARGTSISERMGTRAQMMNVLVTGTLGFAQGSTKTRGVFVAYFVYDRSPRGILPSWTDVFDVAAVNSFQRLDTRDRFEILYRRTWDIEGNGTTPTSDSFVRVELNLPIRRMVSFHSSSVTGAISDIDSGALYLFVLPATSDVSSPTDFGFSMSHRLSFTP